METNNVLSGILVSEMGEARLVQGHIRNGGLLNRVLYFNISSRDLVGQHAGHDTDSDQTCRDSKSEGNDLVASLVLLLDELGGLVNVNVAILIGQIPGGLLGP